MKKFILKYSLIIILNLLFFLIIWYFLDKYFKTNWKILIWALVFSIIPLIFFTNSLLKKSLNELSKIAPNKK